MKNDGTDAISGLSEGAILHAAGQSFAISYLGGDGNDVLLTAVVPEPATWVLLLLGGGWAAALVVRQKRNQRVRTRSGAGASFAAPGETPG